MFGPHFWKSFSPILQTKNPLKIRHTLKVIKFFSKVTNKKSNSNSRVYTVETTLDATFSTSQNKHSSHIKHTLFSPKKMCLLCVGTVDINQHL